MEVMARCRAENMVVTAQDILRYKTIPQLALYLQTARDSVHIIESETEDRLNTPFALSPIQQFYFDSMQNGDDQFNQSFLLQFTKKIPAENIALAIQAIIEQHSMLRARFSHESDGQWTQRIISEVLESYQFRRHDTIDIDDIALIVKTSQASLNIRDGPLFAADFFDDGDEQILFLTAHHLVIDLVSWRIILSDLEDFLRYGTISAPKPLPFQAWSGAQAKHCRQHLNPRNALPFDVKEADYGFWGMSQRPNRFEDVATEVFTMEHDMTAKLFGTCNNALRTEPIELLLSAVIYSFSRAFPERQTPTVFNENHGREPWHASIDPSRTIGWFTTFYPLWVPVDDQEDVVKVIRRTKDQRRQIPDNGWPYFTSRFLHPEGPEAFAKHSKMEVLLNYEGIYQQLERNDALFRQSPWANPRVLGDCGGNVHRSALLELTATAKHGILHFCFEYNRYMDHTDRIKHWVRECERTLREAIEQLMQGNIEYTLSDFPLLPLSYSDLARFVDTTLPSIGILKVEEIEDAYLCSPLQQGMLISQSKQTTLYHIQVVREVMPVEGCSPVDAQRLGAAWQKVVDHHAILRTVFVENICQGGNFGQVVLKKATAAVRYIQWDDSSDDRNGPAKAFDNRSFDDGAKYGPPHRLTICTTSGGRIFFSLEISHTITDGISLSLTLRDLSFAYDAMLPRSPGPLYRNYIAYIRDQNTTDGIEYWKHYVKNVVPCYFPATVQKSDRQAGSGVIDLSFDAFRLRAFCQQHGVSIYNVLQTVWALVLRVFANEDEVCFGYIGSGREIPIHRVQDAVGPYITMLICRVGFSPTESVSEVLHRVHNDFVSSLPHQHACSLAEIQHELKMSGKPLFNSGISVQKGQTESWKSGSFKLRNIKWEDPSEHDIAVNATESRETVSLTFRYLKRSMSEERMSNVAYTFVTILREVIRNPEQTVKQLSHFGERNRNPLWGWNGIVPDKKDACELGAIEYHLRSFLPDGIDVVAELITPVDEESQTILAVFICLRDVLDNGDHGLEDVPVVTRERLISIVAELEEWLSNSLPEYMIPTMFVPLRRIPLTASGKPDRQKLHQLVSGLSKQQLTARSLDASAKRAPSMELEKRLQLLWANVLNVRADRIGIGDNFFKLGGDSITAMRLVATARAAGIYISVADVFNHSTLSELSLSIAAAEGLTEFGIPTCTSSGTTKTAESFPHDALLQRTTSRALTKELEKQLQQLWAGVLNLRADSIGISDNFFKLGGDSITAMRLVATARSSGIHISIAHIFGHPTLLDLSLALSIPDRLRRSAKRHTHFPFSSLDFPDVEEFLEEVVCPQITSERFNIEDALIATDMQAAMIAFGLSRNRGNIHYFTLDFDGHIDSSRLKTACQTLISHHPIFRTVFFAHKSQVFQILLRSIPLEFQRYECENSIEDLSKQLINTDRSLPFAPGDRIVRFMFLEHGTYSARLIIRVSHAQYDGICFPIIIKDLKAAYLGEKIEARPPFSDFVYAINKRNGTKAELFWRTLLENSSMTKFSLYKIPSYENHIDSCVMRSIPFISLGSHGITLASIIKAAWAFILAQLSGTNDVVFGHVVSGRNLFLEGIDQIVGPCINVVPVRVRFQSSTVLDLLCLVQNQYLEAIPFETMGFRRIVERCTEWPLWSRFSSVVQHQNLDEILTSCRFGDTNCKIGAISAPHDVVDVAILSSQQGRKTGISLNYSRRVISQPFAEEVLESLCSTILQFSTDVNAQLPSPSSWSTPYPRIPFLNDTGHGQPLCSIQPSKALVAYQSVVERAWKFVMKAGVGDCTDDFCDPSIPFFDIWGGLIAAAQLSAFYRQEGIQITMEEVLSHPTIGLQTLLVAQRSGVK